MVDTPLTPEELMSIADSGPPTNASSTKLPIALPDSFDDESLVPKLATTPDKLLTEYRVRYAAKMRGVDPDLAAAVAKQESGFNPRAVSPTGVKGTMQVTQRTARILGYNRDDEDQNILAGVEHLARYPLEAYPDPNDRHHWIPSVLGMAKQSKAAATQTPPTTPSTPSPEELMAIADGTPPATPNTAPKPSMDVPAWVTKEKTAQDVWENPDTPQPILTQLKEIGLNTIMPARPLANLLKTAAAEPPPGYTKGGILVKALQQIPGSYDPGGQAAMQGLIGAEREQTARNFISDLTSGRAGDVNFHQLPEEQQQQQRGDTSGNLVTNMLEEAVFDPTTYILPGIHRLAKQPIKPDVVTKLDDILKQRQANEFLKAVDGPLGAEGSAQNVDIPLSRDLERSLTIKGTPSRAYVEDPSTATINDILKYQKARAELPSVTHADAPPTFYSTGKPSKASLKDILAYEKRTPASLTPGEVQVEVGGDSLKRTLPTKAPMKSMMPETSLTTEDGLGLGYNSYSQGLEGAVDFGGLGGKKDITKITKDTPLYSLTLKPEERVFSETMSRQTESVLDSIPDLKEYLKYGDKPGSDRGIRYALRKTWGDAAKEIQYEPKGGEVLQRTIRAATGMEDEVQAVNGMWDDFGKKFSKLGKVGKGQLTEAVAKAAQDRSNADKYLRTPLEREAYELWLKNDEFIRPRMEAAGKKALDNYFTRNRELLNNLSKDGYIGRKNLSAKSNYIKERTIEGGDYRLDDLTQIAKQHNLSVLRELHMQPVVEWARINGALTPKTQNFLTNVINPDISPTGIVGKLTGRLYQSYVRYNPLTAWENRSQEAIARMSVSPQAEKVFRLIGEQPEKLGLDRFAESGFVSRFNLDDVPDVAVKSKIDKVTFPGSELRNHRNARLLGISEEIAQHPKYQELVKQGVNPLEAVAQTLDQPAWDKLNKTFVTGETVLERGMTRGQDINAISNFLNIPGLRPGWVDMGNKVPGAKALTQFTRYPTSASETLIDQFTRKGQVYRILRRGFNEEVQIAQEYLKTKQALQGAQRIGKDTKLKTALIDAPKLKKHLAFLEGQLDKIEPKNNIAKLWDVAELVGRQIAPKTAKGWLGYQIKQQVDEAMGAEKSKDPRMEGLALISIGLDKVGLGVGNLNKNPLARSLYNATLDSFPFGGASDLVTETLRVGKQPSSAVNQVTSKAISMTPIGAIESIPGRPASRALSTLFKEEMKKARKKRKEYEEELE